MSTLKGKLIVIKETATFGSNGFRKREVVIETDSQYPQKILIEFVQDKCDLVNAFAVGQAVEIGYNINGREWINPEGVAKYFNAIQGWRIEGSEKAVPPVAEKAVPQSEIEQEATAPSDLPF